MERQPSLQTTEKHIAAKDADLHSLQQGNSNNNNIQFDKSNLETVAWSEYDLVSNIPESSSSEDSIKSELCDSESDTEGNFALVSSWSGSSIHYVYNNGTGEDSSSSDTGSCRYGDETSYDSD